MVAPDIQIATPMVIGRESELDTLAQALQNAQHGTGRCMLVAGEAGIGKSRLVAELVSRALTEQFAVLRGQCLEQDVAFPYAPWIDALRTCFARQSASAISELLGPLAPEFVKLLPELSLLSPHLQPTPPLEAEAEKRRRFESLARFVANLSTANPLLIVLEDLHWSDELSLEMLHFLARRISDLPIVLIGTFRTEALSSRLGHHLSDLNRERLVQEIRLAPLARAQVEQMVRAILKTEQVISDRLLHLLYPLTEGNPFFIEEMIKSLIQAGSLSERQGRWELKSGSGLHIPRDVQDAVQQRVELLPEQARRLLTVAAVVGQRFDVGLLQAMARQDEQQLLQGLKELISAQFIVEESSDQFAFRHALTREAVYAMPMLRERRTLHKQIGETMEQFWGAASHPAGRSPAGDPASGSLAAELAYHFEQAAVWDKALQYSQQAGEQAQRLYAPREALAHFSRALEAAKRLNIAPASSLLSGRAHALELLGEFDPARAAYEMALDLARRAGDRQAEWTTLIDLGFLWQSRDWVRAGDYFERAFNLARSLEEPALVAQSLNRIGNWQMNRGRPSEALSSHQQALALFIESNDQRGVAHTLELLGFTSYSVGAVVQGVAYCEQALPILRELDDRQGLVNTLLSLSLRPRFDTEVMGELDLKQLVNMSETALEIARSCGYRKGEADALTKAAFCHCRAGDYGHGFENLRSALAIAEEIGHRELLATVHLVDRLISLLR